MKKLFVILFVFQVVSGFTQVSPPHLDTTTVKKNKIKSVTISHEEYDENGKLIESVFSRMVEYDRNGNVILERESSGYVTTYHYVKNGFPDTVKYIQASGIVRGYSVYTYNPGKEHHRYYENGILVSEDIHDYSSTGKPLRLIHLQNGNYHSEYSYQYDSNDSLVRRTFYSSNRAVIHDKDGNMIELIHYKYRTLDSSKISTHQFFEYNEQKLLIKQIDSTSAGIAGYRNYYNPQGQLIRRTDLNGKVLYDHEKDKIETDHDHEEYELPHEEIRIERVPFIYPQSESEKEKKYDKKKLLVKELLFTHENGIKTYVVYSYTFY